MRLKLIYQATVNGDKFINLSEATKNLSNILEQVAKGEQFILMKEGKEVARILPPQQARKAFPSLNSFRKSIVLKLK
jgi:prevent-host-death family protein